MKSNSEHICVCVCTFKRPELIRRLLEKLQHQKTDNLFTYSAVVVDNDTNRTAEKVVTDIQKQSSFRIEYYVEPEQNIALARNKAVEMARGNYIAFIDDDEFAIDTWLLHHFRILQAHRSDGVLGPVKPDYPDGCPQWLIKSRLCERPEHPTGMIMHWSQTRTGNVLLKGKIFDDPSHRFGAEFGRTGGEDIEFFRKVSKARKTFIWCNEAVVYETVSPERWGKRFYSQRFLRIGGLVGEKIRRRETTARIAWALIKSFGWIAAMTVFMPFAKLAGDHLHMRAKTKITYNFGLISGVLQRTIIRNREE